MGFSKDGNHQQPQIVLGLLVSENGYPIDYNIFERLVVNYKEQRAHKDTHNRKRGLEKLQKNLKTGKLNKKLINNKGYNKYLKMDGDISIVIDYDKYHDDAKWDGLKGYVINTGLTKEEVIEKYNQLWTIEKTFRISKSDLQIRPTYHRLKRRIEAHICISFAACKIYKELERQLKEKKSELSPQKAIDILKTIYKVTIQTPYSLTMHERMIIKNQEQSDLIELFDLKL
jgi:transposase